ncbi:MAG TPA: glycosyltransferase family 1 protein [Bacillales bacterium]|nr:glycosyltransferase family 1 protein [Bacillales bacterium]
MNRGGTETLLMNVYRNLDRSKIQFDFISHRNEKCDYDDEITSLGGKIFRIQSLGQLGPAGYMKELKKVMLTNSYVAVHAHTDYQSGFPAFAAKLVGIKRRICHSHSNHFPIGNGMKEKTMLRFLQSIIKYAATDYAACSKEAALFLFGKKTIEDQKFHVLKNGIEITAFVNGDEDCNLKVKQELNIPYNAKIIGHIGTFSESKNHKFILKVLKRMVEKNNNIYVVLVGDGPLKQQIEEDAKEQGVYDHIRFLGVRGDVPRVMKAFDVFLFPSIYEGFGIVMIEAQSSGIPCVVSDGVPKSTDMGLELVSFVSLTDNLDTWTDAIDESFAKVKPLKELVLNHISKQGFDIKSNVPKWVELYE